MDLLAARQVTVEVGWERNQLQSELQTAGRPTGRALKAGAGPLPPGHAVHRPEPNSKWPN